MKTIQFEQHHGVPVEEETSQHWARQLVKSARKDGKHRDLFCTSGDTFVAAVEFSKGELEIFVCTIRGTATVNVERDK